MYDILFTSDMYDTPYYKFEILRLVCEMFREFKYKLSRKVK